MNNCPKCDRELYYKQLMLSLFERHDLFERSVGFGQENTDRGSIILFPNDDRDPMEIRLPCSAKEIECMVLEFLK